MRYKLVFGKLGEHLGGEPWGQLFFETSLVFTFAMADIRQRRGRSPERVYATPPSKSLECVVCLNILSDSVSLPACGHTFCRGCVASVLAKPAAQRKCPNCRKGVAPSVAAAALPLNWTVKSFLDALRVRCRAALLLRREGGGRRVGGGQAGCPAQLTLDGAAAHEATCGFATTVICPFAGCGVELRRSDVASHNAASMQAHLDGERAARLTDAARVAASDARLAALEARLAACELGVAVGPQTRSDWWAVRNTIQAVDTENEDEDEDSVSLQIWCCAFNPSGSVVCVALENGELKLFDVASADHRLTLSRHERGVNCCAFSLDGSTSDESQTSRLVVPASICCCVDVACEVSSDNPEEF